MKLGMKRYRLLFRTPGRAFPRGVRAGGFSTDNTPECHAIVPCCGPVGLLGRAEVQTWREARRCPQRVPAKAIVANLAGMLGGLNFRIILAFFQLRGRLGIDDEALNQPSKSGKHCLDSPFCTSLALQVLKCNRCEPQLFLMRINSLLTQPPKSSASAKDSLEDMVLLRHPRLDVGQRTALSSKTAKRITR